jgi:hypothetical protein
MWPPYFFGASLATANLRTSILLRARAASTLSFQGLVGDFYHFLEVVVRLLLARAYCSRKSSFVCAFVMDRR